MRIILYSKGYLDSKTKSECARLIVSGGSITLGIEDLIHGLDAAKLVCVIKHYSTVCAVGAIKRVQKEYNERISELSNYPVKPRAREIGYISVLPEHQGVGLSKIILSTLLDNYKYKIIAVTGNERMKRSNISYGLRQVGISWTGSLGKELTLWIR